MAISEDCCARDMDLKKSMRFGLDECLVALRESYADLPDDAFHRFALEGHMNVATLVVHCLQQHDDFNGSLQYKRGIPGKLREWHFLEPEERFGLWGLPQDKLPKPGQAFPSVPDVLAVHDEVHRHLLDNVDALSEDDFVTTPAGRWPRLCDKFFRAIYHTNAHVRQIWFLRGRMGVDTGWPVQHYA